MKVTQVAEVIKYEQVMDVSVDVHKEDLYSLAQMPGKKYAATFKKRTPQIQKVVEVYQKIAQEHECKHRDNEYTMIVPILFSVGDSLLAIGY